MKNVIEFFKSFAFMLYSLLFLRGMTIILLFFIGIVSLIIYVIPPIPPKEKPDYSNISLDNCEIVGKNNDNNYIVKCE